MLLKSHVNARGNRIGIALTQAGLAIECAELTVESFHKNNNPLRRSGAPDKSLLMRVVAILVVYKRWRYKVIIS